MLRALLSGGRAFFVSRTVLALRVAALEQQLAAFQARGVRPKVSRLDRVFWIALLRRVPSWKRWLVFVKPQTVIRWHRIGYRIFWRWKSKPGRPAVEPELAKMIRTMSLDNSTWGARRIADELEKLGHFVSVATVRKHMVEAPTTGPQRARSGQSWKTFLANHSPEVLACDFLTQHTAGFRNAYIFVVLHLETRQVLRAAVTESPSLDWVKNQLREVLAFEHPYRFLIHDNDGIFGQFGARHRKLFRVRCHLDRWLAQMGVHGIPTPYHAPNANAYVERFNRALREECLDHFIFFGEDHLQRVVDEYVDFYNHARPSQGIGRIPRPRDGPANSNVGPAALERVTALPVLGGLHHDYRRAA